MKKNKKLLLFSLLILFIQLTVSGAMVEKIVYHTGEDFVQLFFKTNGIVSIPDLFYPQKGNSKFLVMRVSGIDFKDSKNVYKFDSPIVKSLRVKKKKGFYDIEINLKEVVNYRVATNSKGLFIEFPNVKNVFLSKKEYDVKPKLIKKKNLNIEKKFYSRNNRLKRFEIIEKGKNNVKFKFLMSAENVKHEVIEVNNKPFRLALDFFNTKSKVINKSVNSFNVDKVRGAQNRDNVFRVVFDLNSLKNFKVTTGNKLLFVEFYNNNYKNHIVKNKKENKTNIITETKSIDLAKVKPKEKIVKKIVNTPKQEIAKNKKLNNKITLKKDEYFSEPTSETSTGEAENFMEIEDEKGNINKGIITVYGGEPKYKGAPIDINVKNQDLAHLINGFAELAKINIILDPGVTGKVTANLKKVPWDQALDLFLKVNKLGKVIEGNILRIGKISVLANESKQLRVLEMAKAAVEEMIVKNYTVSYAKAGELSVIIKAQLSPRGKLYVDKRTNTMIVTDIADKLKVIDNLVEVLDMPTAQVSIEAKIIETNVTYYNALGIQWGYDIMADAAHGNPTSLKFPNSIGVGGNLVPNTTAPGVTHPGGTGGYAINMPAPKFNVGTAFTFGNVADTFRLDLALTAMESSGKGKILSSPKTTTQNNLTAKISQGSKIPLQTLQNNTVTTKYVNAVLELEVTPQITAKGTVKLEINIKNDAPDWSREVDGIPPLSTQTLTTTIMAKDGETIVIGGMYKIEDATSGNKVPLLSRIPIIGSLFKNKLKTGSRKEILIFVTPRIVK